MGSCASTQRVTVHAPSAAHARGPSVLPGRCEFDDVYAVYAFGPLLYQGELCSVHRVTHKETGEAYACKSISKSKLVSAQELQDVQNEVRLLKNLTNIRHPNVANFIQSFEDPGQVHVIMEECAGGDLFDRILRQRCLCEKDGAETFSQVASAVQQLHNLRIVHRDIKPESFMFLTPSPDSCLKIISLRCAIQLPQHQHQDQQQQQQQQQQLDDVIGSPSYVAPEMLRGVGYGCEADIWSCGVLLYILLAGYPPFQGTSNNETFEQIVTCPLNLKTQPWPSVSAAAKDLVRKLLTRDPLKRITAAQVLHHPWFSEQAAAPRGSGHVILQSLRLHRQFHRLKRATLLVLAASTSQDEYEGLMKVFEEMDKDNDGQLSAADLRRGLIRQGVNVAVDEVEHLLTCMDIDGNGCVDRTEFVAATLHGIARGLSEGSRHTQLRAAFKQFDLNGSGFISREELKAVLKGSGQELSNEELETIMQETDRNRDGKIDYHEFVSMVLHSDVQGGVVNEQSRRLHIAPLQIERLRSEPLADLVLEHQAEQTEKCEPKSVEKECGTDGKSGAEARALLGDPKGQHDFRSSFGSTASATAVRFSPSELRERSSLCGTLHAAVMAQVPEYPEETTERSPTGRLD